MDYRFILRRALLGMGAVLLIGGSKAGRGERFYAETVPKAERLYLEYVRLRESEEGGT